MKSTININVSCIILFTLNSNQGLSVVQYTKNYCNFTVKRYQLYGIRDNHLISNMT